VLRPAAAGPGWTAAGPGWGVVGLGPAAGLGTAKKMGTYSRFSKSSSSITSGHDSPRGDIPAKRNFL